MASRENPNPNSNSNSNPDPNSNPNSNFGAAPRSRDWGCTLSKDGSGMRNSRGEEKKRPKRLDFPGVSGFPGRVVFPGFSRNYSSWTLSFQAGSRR